VNLWPVVVGLLSIAIGVIQFAFVRRLERSRSEDVKSLGFPKSSGPHVISPTFYLLTRCVPFWIVGIFLVVTGLLSR
jgi:hypothetical protein